MAINCGSQLATGGYGQGASTVFKNSIANTSRYLRDSDQPENLNQHGYCISEPFTGDLATGNIQLGEQTSRVHGLSVRSSGLLAITRVYPQSDRIRILNIFEHACMRSTRFSFNTTILHLNGEQIPLLCTGETLVSTDGHSGIIKGVFVFSHMQLN